MDGLTRFDSIEFKLGIEVICDPQNGNEMFEVAATIFRPTSQTNQNRPIAKFLNICVFSPTDLDEI